LFSTKVSRYYLAWAQALDLTLGIWQTDLSPDSTDLLQKMLVNSPERLVHWWQSAKPKNQAEPATEKVTSKEISQPMELFWLLQLEHLAQALKSA